MKTITIKDDGKTKTSELMAELKKKVDVYCYWNDKELDKNFPKPEKATTREFAIEAESSGMKGSSWNEMKDIRDGMMTFREYILYFAAHFHETGRYPDEIGWTLFKDGLPDGSVAFGFWNPYARRAYFSWNGPDFRNSPGGARVAISLSPSAMLVPSATDLTLALGALEEAEAKIKIAYELIKKAL